MIETATPESPVNGLGAALGFVSELTRKALKTTILDAPLERKGAYYLVDEKGDAQLKVADAEWDDQVISTPPDLVHFVDKRKQPISAVFLNEQKVVFVYDIEDRRNKATVNLIQSEVYQWLVGKSKNPMSQTDFVRLLRITLRGCLPSDTNLLALIRNLKFQASSETGASLQHGNDRMGKSINAAVSADYELPQEIPLSVQVFENFNGYRATIPCAIEIFTTDQTFKLTPYPMTLKVAMENTLDVIAEQFDTDGMPPVYRGQP